MGLGVQDVMKAAEPTCIMLRDSLENVREARSRTGRLGAEGELYGPNLVELTSFGLAGLSRNCSA